MAEKVTGKENRNMTEKTKPGAKKKTSSVGKPASKDNYKKKYETAKKQLKESHDKHLRLSAEFDNYRKRTLKEKSDLTKTANENILINILPVIDDFERGLQHIDEAKDINAVKEGMQLIYSKFIEFLKQNNVKEVHAMNAEFDTEKHDAVTKIPAPSKDMKGKVVDVIEKGYMLHDKIIRYPKVVVGE
jgi:molecular chaperone GrpE